MSIFETEEVKELRKEHPFNIEYYKLKNVYELEEIPYVCLGINPDCKHFKILVKSINCEVPIMALNSVCRIRELIVEALEVNELSCINTKDGSVKIKAVELYFWAKSNGISFSNELEKHIMQNIEKREKSIRTNKITKERAKPAQEKVICIILDCYSELEKSDKSLTDIFFNKGQDLFKKDAPSKNIIIEVLKNAQQHHPKDKKFVKSKK